MRRLAILATHPVQYQCPLWAKLAQTSGLSTKVFFGSDFSIRGYQDQEFATAIAWEKNILRGFDHVFLSTDQWHPVTFRSNNTLYTALDRFGATDLLLNAYAPIFYWQGLRWAWNNRARVHFRGDTTDVDRERSYVVRTARNVFLSLFYSRVDTFCAVGHHSRLHYLSRGIDPSRVFDSPFSVDTDAFEQLYQLYRGRRDQLRADWNLADSDLVLIFSGKLIPKKDPLTLIEAIASLPSVGGRVIKVLVAGDGPLRDVCQKKSSQNCAERVTFLGFRSQEELAAVYIAGDALVLPSIRSETWGLVVNEALQFGIPCVVSDRVGCVEDLVYAGTTGESFRHGDVDALRAAIVRLAGWLNSRRDDVAARCRSVASRYNLDASAAGIARAVLHGSDAGSSDCN